MKISVNMDMTKAGIQVAIAKALSEGAGLKGAMATEFVENQKISIGTITHEQQIKLFDNIYPEYESRQNKIMINGLLAIKIELFGVN